MEINLIQQYMRFLVLAWPRFCKYIASFKVYDIFSTVKYFQFSEQNFSSRSQRLYPKSWPRPRWDAVYENVTNVALHPRSEFFFLFFLMYRTPNVDKYSLTIWLVPLSCWKNEFTEGQQVCGKLNTGKVYLITCFDRPNINVFQTVCHRIRYSRVAVWSRLGPNVMPNHRLDEAGKFLCLSIVVHSSDRQMIVK